MAASSWASSSACPQPQEEPLLVPVRRAASERAFERWKQQHGGGWVIDIDPHTGRVNFLGGGSLGGGSLGGGSPGGGRPGGGNLGAITPPSSDADFEQLARSSIVQAHDLVGVDVESLRFERVKFLPLGMIGSTDKWSVSFQQQHGGLQVFGGRVNVLLDLDGSMLSIQSTALSSLDGLGLSPSLAANVARNKARLAFEGELGVTPTAVDGARLGIGSALVNQEREARLVWELDASWRVDGVRPEGRRYWIDASTGETLRSIVTVHDLDVSGTVATFATPGTTPDTTLNPAVYTAVKDLRVQGLSGNFITDAAGNFIIPGVTGPVTVTAEFIGPWAHVDNDVGAEEVVVQQISGSGNTLLLNPAPAGAVTSQANAFVEIGRLHDWIRAVDPTDSTADFQAYARVNLASVCNAYFDGFSVNFFAPGGGCASTSYSTVVAHEMGHWLNVLYNTGNGWDGMGEGNADVFAMYLYDTPIVGDGFFGPGTSIRTGLNTRMFCGDCCAGCYGGSVHTEGEVWMGAAWKIRSRLNATNGNVLGDMIADGLFSGWMNAYDQAQIKSVIELQWLVLDDDNGFLDDGTPHFDDIDPGFRDQGFPGYDRPVILYSDVTIQADTVDEQGPYQIQTNAVAQASAGIGNMLLMYRVDGGAWMSRVMVFLGGDLYVAYIPGQASVATVEYYLSGVDLNSVVATYPKAGAADPIRFVVGLVDVLFFDDLEGADDRGWTHGSFGDTTNAHDDFQRGAPAGRAGDPSSAVSGAKVWGNDLGQGAWNGAYQSNQHNWLRTPAIDCSLAINTELRFARWLNVDSSQNDTARILVNGTEVFINDGSGATRDSSWTDVTLDIAAQADGQAAVVVEFSIETGATGSFGGWNLDDVEVRFVAPSPTSVGTAYCFGDGSSTACPCGNSSLPGHGCANSSGAGAILVGLGSTSRQADDLSLRATSLIAGQPALLFSGINAVASGMGVAFGDGLRCAGGGITRLGVRSASPAGAANWGPGLASSGAWSAGDTRRFQCWYRDPLGGPCGTNFNLTHGVEVLFTQ